MGLGNGHVTYLSLAGVILICLGTTLGIIGLATSQWFAIDTWPLSDALTKTSSIWPHILHYADFPIHIGVTQVSCHFGLWQICCSEYGSIGNCSNFWSRDVNDAENAIRILMVIMVVVLIASVILLLVYMFKDSCHPRLGCRQCVTLVVSVGCLGFLMLVMAYTLLEYTQKDGWFTSAIIRRATLSWSFFLALVGALLNPVGLFLVCTQWHLSEDKDAGVRFTYDDKTKLRSSTSFDTYI